MPTINYNIRTTKDDLTVELYKTGITDTLISGHTINNTIGVENIFPFSDEIFENGGYKIKLIDSLLNEVLFDGIDVNCFAPPSGWAFTIQTDAFGATNITEFTLPTVDGYNYNAIVDWGDGSTSTITGATDPNINHVYSSGGTYQIIINDLFEAFSFEESTIGNANKLTTIDTPIHINNVLKYIQGGFSDCGNLISIPNDLFRYCDSTLTSFYRTFYNCTSLASIYSDLFRYNTGVTEFISTFAGCISLLEIPSNLFDYNILAQNFSRTFDYCNSITSIPSDLFKYNVNAIDMNGIFIYCQNLLSIPVDLFRYNTGVTTFLFGFQNCISLTSIPENIFYYNTSVINYGYVFSYCKNINLPTTIFNLNNLNIVEFFTGFMCISDNIDGYVGTIQDIWNYATHPSLTKIVAFLNQTTLTNYASIPIDWKS